MKFDYTGIDQSGRDVRGQVEADSTEGALSKIRNLGHFATRVRGPEDPAEDLLDHPALQVDEYSRKVRLVVTFAPIVMFVIGLACLSIPLNYWWDHDELNSLQVMKDNWKSSFASILIFGALTLWAKVKRWLSE